MAILTSRVAHLFSRRYPKLAHEILQYVTPYSEQLKLPQASVSLREIDDQLPNITSIFVELTASPSAELHEISTDLFLVLGEYFDLRHMNDEKRTWGWALVTQAQSPELPPEFAHLVEPTSEILALFEEPLTTPADYQVCHDLAETYNKLGLHHWYSGEPQLAVNALQKALFLFEKANEVLGQVGALLNISNVLYAVGQLEDNLQVVRRAYAIAQSGEDVDLRFQVLVHLANALGENNLQEEACQAFEEAITYYQSKNELEAAEIHFNYALYLTKISRQESAIQHAQHALLIYQAHDEPIAQTVQAWLNDQNQKIS